METVYVWVDKTIWPGHEITRGQCPDHPVVDVSSPDDVDQAQLRAYVLESWNRNYPDDTLTENDFQYVDRPEGWAAPKA
jgi:hypothetical protein